VVGAEIAEDRNAIRPRFLLIMLFVQFPFKAQGSSTPITWCLTGRLFLKSNTSTLSCMTAEGDCAEDSMDIDIKTTAQVADRDRMREA